MSVDSTCAGMQTAAYPLRADLQALLAQPANDTRAPVTAFARRVHCRHPCIQPRIGLRTSTRRAPAPLQIARARHPQQAAHPADRIVVAMLLDPGVSHRTVGVRRYSNDDVNRIRFIKRAQQLGFTLDEITNLLKLEDGRSCRETEQLARQKLSLVEARIADLQRLRKTLRDLIGRCESGRGRITCPIIRSLMAER